MLFILGILGVLIYLSVGELSNTETGLLSTILTMLSVIAAWVVSHLYAASAHEKAIEEVKSAHQENLQTYALKAAEKVNNLSDQLNKLAVYIKEEIENSDYDTVEETLRAREERLHSAIHMIAMLKSVNDTSLSDWQGVIGDELNEQREERQERETEFREIAARLETLWESKSIDKTLGNEFSRQLGDIKSDVSHLMLEMTGSSIKIAKPRKKNRRLVESSCASCDGDISYTQLAKTNSHKVVKCQSCNTQYVSRFSMNDSDFILEPRAELEENCQCPECLVMSAFELDNFPNARKVAICNHCSSKFRVARARNGDIKIDSYRVSAKSLSQNFLDEVISLLPPQPWPKDTHKAVALKLKCTPSKVSKATKILIQQGLYKSQVDGKLYEPLEVGAESNERFS